MTDEAPDNGQDQPLDAPQEGTSVTTEQPSFEAPFNIHDVDEAYRGDVERYAKQLQGAYTQKTQGLADERKQYQQAVDFVTRLQSDPEFQAQQFRQLAGALGYQIQDPEPVEEYLDPTDQLATRLSTVEQALSQRAQAEQQYEADGRDITHIGHGLREVQQQIGRDLTQEEIQILGDAAWANRDEQGIPNIQAVGQMFMAALAAQQQQRIASKKAPRVGSGVPGQPKPDLSTPEGRTAHMAAIVEAEMQG